MSESIRRRSSSRQLLQNLIRVTAQRSQEDAEEVERERRRRAREKQRGEGSPSWPEPPHHNNLTQHNTELDEELKPSCCLVLEEDEGFSDWSHRLENRNEQEVPDDCRARVRTPSVPQWKPGPEEEKQQEDEEQGREPERCSRPQEASTRPAEKTSSNKKDVRTSYSSSVFLPQDTRLQHATGQPPDRTSYLAAGTMRPRCLLHSGGAGCRVDGEVEQEVLKEEEVQPSLQREWRSAEPRQSRRDEGDLDEEELSFTHEEREDLHLRTEQRHREEEEEEEEEEHKRSVKSRDRRSDEVNRRSAVSLCSSSSEGEELLNCYGPMSPTFKKLLIQFYPDEVNSRVSTDGQCTIVERTESLRKSTNNIKKTLPPVAVSKIHKKLEQYTHALEVSSMEGKAGGPALTDLTSPTEPVASKKNLFEAGEAWNQNAISVPSSKDADGLKVGVAELINQWVRGSEDGSRCSSPFKPAESSAGKRYKFVVTGHGKYEKVSVDNGCSKDVNCQSAGQLYEDL
ncbi:lymphocyte-specific protein 1-like isoform X2 [Toxotes jaculatrix]|uniref:lymphocyte-specific protein 1-like isoform X2 n=1 Tax=Toxotes jaculatrix TaxID=941984 RepID=UPI001B3AF2C3|nr:lymphocyte-specific protein 1-like isoform X2 [Toxotes jaculatrix]